MLMFLPVFLAVPSAHAQAVARCSPTPCTLGVPPGASVAQADADPPVVVGGSAVGLSDRSPVPFVSLGLLAVAGSLTVVALRRRSHIVRRSAPARPDRVGTAPGPSRPERQAAFR